MPSEQRKAYYKRWYSANKAKCREYSRQRRTRLSKECKEYDRQRWAKYALTYKNHYLKKKYGITSEQFEAMIVQQNGCCQICGKRFVNSKSIHVDHNHRTGKVRSLLCGKCNSGLGYFGECIDNLLNAIQYLTKWQTE